MTNSFVQLSTAQRLLGLTLTIAVAVTVTWLMLAPVKSGPPGLPHLDKLAHFLAFFGITLPAAAVLPRKDVVIVLAAALFGLGIELVQPSFGRFFEWGDVAANALGATCGAVIGRAWVFPWLAARQPR